MPSARPRKRHELPGTRYSLAITIDTYVNYFVQASLPVINYLLVRKLASCVYSYSTVYDSISPEVDVSHNVCKTAN